MRLTWKYCIHVHRVGSDEDVSCSIRSHAGGVQQPGCRNRAGAPANVTLCAPAGGGTVVSSISTVNTNNAAWVIRPARQAAYWVCLLRDDKGREPRDRSAVRDIHCDAAVHFCAFIRNDQFVASDQVYFSASMNRNARAERGT